MFKPLNIAFIWAVSSFSNITLRLRSSITAAIKASIPAASRPSKKVQISSKLASSFPIATLTDVSMSLKSMSTFNIGRGTDTGPIGIVYCFNFQSSQIN